jgi:Prenyltransferase and squalene oxidase repeat/Ankyrin repeat
MIGALLRAGADVNAKDVRRMTALMLAVTSETQNVKVVELLLKAGAQVNDASLTSETALDWANKFGNASVIAALKKAGAKTGAAYIPPDAFKPAEGRDVRQALCASLGLLQRSSTEFFKKSGCVGCHHQPMAAMAVRAARRAGLPVDEQAAKEQLRMMSSQAASSGVRVLQGMERASEVDLGLAQGLREAEYPPDTITDSLVTRIATTQRSDGSWVHGHALSRAPSGESDLGPTVQAVRALQVYSFPAAKAAFDARIANARRWLLQQQPRTTDESAMLLLGLTWTSADSRKVRRLANSLISQQRADGGWAGNPNLTSDAFATGEAAFFAYQSPFLMASPNEGAPAGFETTCCPAPL